MTIVSTAVALFNLLGFVFIKLSCSRGMGEERTEDERDIEDLIVAEEVGIGGTTTGIIVFLLAYYVHFWQS